MTKTPASPGFFVILKPESLELGRRFPGLPSDPSFTQTFPHATQSFSLVLSFPVSVGFSALRGPAGFRAVFGTAMGFESVPLMHVPALCIHWAWHRVHVWCLARTERRLGTQDLWSAGADSRWCRHRCCRQTRLADHLAAGSGARMRPAAGIHVGNHTIRGRDSTSPRRIRRMREGGLDLSRTVDAGLEPAVVSALGRMGCAYCLQITLKSMFPAG